MKRNKPYKTTLATTKDGLEEDYLHDRLLNPLIERERRELLTALLEANDATQTSLAKAMIESHIRNGPNNSGHHRKLRLTSIRKVTSPSISASPNLS